MEILVLRALVLDDEEEGLERKEGCRVRSPPVQPFDSLGDLGGLGGGVGCGQRTGRIPMTRTGGNAGSFGGQSGQPAQDVR